jgi:4-methylaminobutanoate oxidase (formaldehyde-forming)
MRPQLHVEVKRGKDLGLDVAMMSFDEARRPMPYLGAGMHMRSDIYLEPVQVPIGYARASARLGAALLGHTPSPKS